MTLSKTPALYVLAGSGSLAMSHISDAEALTGMIFNVIEVFNANVATWADWEDPWFCNDPSQGYIDWVAADSANRRLIVSTLLIPQEAGSMSDPQTWETSGAAGNFNTHATALAENLVAAGFGNSVIRLGFECNGNWNIDAIGGSTPGGGTTTMRSLWAQTFQQEVTAMRAVTGANFLFCWCPNAVVAGVPFADYYPGNSYVDIIAIDAYDAFANGTQPAASELTTADLFAQSYGLNDITTFAVAQGKPLGLGEYGIQAIADGGLGDDPYYIQGLAAWIEANDFAFHSYFDSNNDGIAPLSSAYPLTLAAYKFAFGGALNANADFESGVSPWSANGANTVLSQGSSWFAAGAHSAQVSVTASSNFPGMVSEDITISENRKYRYKATVDAPAVCDIQLGIHWYDSSRNFISSSYDENSLAANTALVFGPNDVTSPPNAGIAVLFAQLDGTAATGVVFNVDEITLKDITTGVIGSADVTMRKMTVSQSSKRVTWDGSTDRTYSTGVSNAVLYPKNSPGVAWNGLISVTEKGDDNTTTISLDGQLSIAESLPGTFDGSLSAYMYPDQLEPCIGNIGGLTAQPRQAFGLTYMDNRQLHILYNVLLKPGSDKYETLGDNPSALAFGWEFTTTPVEIPWGRPSSHIVIMIDEAAPAALSALESVLYGDSANNPSLPDPLSIYNIFDPYALMTVTDNGDGTWTANDNDHGAISMIDSTHFEINWPSAVYLSDTTYRIHSL